MIDCIIVDDEPLALDVLENYISRIPALDIKKRCNNAVEAFDHLQNNKVDLIFLDIHMPELSGIEFLRSIGGDPTVIFTTAYPNYALEGFDLDVVDYLLKPVSFERFLQSVNKASKVIDEKSGNKAGINEDFIFVKNDQKITKVKYDDILFVEGMKDYVKIFTVDGMLVTHQTMKNMEEKLPDSQFIRIHKSYIVAFDKVSSVMGNSLQVGEKLLPLGQIYRASFLSMVDKHNISK